MTQAPKKWMRFHTWYVRSLHRIGASKTVVRELGKYKLDFVYVQEVKWEKSSTEQAKYYIFFYGEENADHQFRDRIFHT
jgi:exonuclease III